MSGASAREMFTPPAASARASAALAGLACAACGQNYMPGMQSWMAARFF
ncbi:MAG: hypothetical protein Q7V01_12255 [Vicinamibacterales bacterium]|nr:hypothetical protein [Vicinamibacterales bacterium]